MKWIQGGNNSADLHTRNPSSPDHEKHASKHEDIASVADEGNGNTCEEECQDEANKNGVTGAHGTQGAVPPAGIVTETHGWWMNSMEAGGQSVPHPIRPTSRNGKSK